MTTALAPEFVPTPAPAQVLDTEALVETELGRLRAFYQKHDQARGLPDEDRQFVARCLKRHLPLIRMWGSWRFEQPVEDVFIDTKALSQIMSEITLRWSNGVQLKNRTYPPISFSAFVDRHEALFCGLHGCHVPSPVYHSDVWASRNALETREYEVGTQFYVPLRKGQAVSRGVLAAIRKQFAGNEPYIAYWEAVMEALGVQYATAKPYRIVLSTAPSDMMALGLLGESSCYTTGGEWERSKLHLSLLPNSVVMLVYIEGQEKPVGRAWGLLAPKKGGAEFTNFYLLPRDQILPGLKSVLRKALQLQTDLLVGGESSLKPELQNAGYMFVNDDSICLWTQGNQQAVQEEILRGVKRFRENADGDAKPSGFPTCPSCARNTGVPTLCTDCDYVGCPDCRHVDLEDTRVLCDRCAARRSWFECECGNWTSAPREAAGTFDLYCRTCIEKKFTECDRCAAWWDPAQLVICDACKDVRCPSCTEEGESACPTAATDTLDPCLCRECAIAQGLIVVEPAEPPLQINYDWGGAPTLNLGHTFTAAADWPFTVVHDEGGTSWHILRNNT
jgi:hypothetical protein